MRYLDSVRRAARSLKNAKGRTILTAMAIAVGGFTLTLAISAGTGARQYADKLITSNIDPQSLFIAKDKTLFGEGGAPGGGGLKEYSPDAASIGGATFKALNEKDIQTIEENPNVFRVAPTYLVQAQYFTFEGDEQRYTTDVTAYDSSVRSEVAAGRLPELGTQIPTDGAVVPESFLRSLKGSPSASSMIGKTITLRLAKAQEEPTQKQIQEVLLSDGPEGLEKAFAPETRDIELKVSAVSAASSTSLTASNGLFISQLKAEELSNYLTRGTDQYKKYVTATATVKEGVDPASVKTELEKSGVTVRTAEDLQSLLFTIVNILQGIVIGFGFLALIASVFGIINTQYISVLERTREIGLMKALGMRGRHVRRLFQLEAAWIGLLGGVIGALLAWGIGTAINPWLSEIIGLGDELILVFDILPIVILIIVLMLIAMLAGWFPARKAAKLDPIEALRTE